MGVLRMCKSWKEKALWNVWSFRALLIFRYRWTRKETAFFTRVIEWVFQLVWGDEAVDSWRKDWEQWLRSKLKNKVTGEGQ